MNHQFIKYNVLLYIHHYSLDDTIYMQQGYHQDLCILNDVDCQTHRNIFVLRQPTGGIPFPIMYMIHLIELFLVTYICTYLRMYFSITSFM